MDNQAEADQDELGARAEAADQAELGNLAEAENPVGVGSQVGADLGNQVEAGEIVAVYRVEGLMQL